MVEPASERHRQAAFNHDAADKRHGESAAYWEREGDLERAGLERRNEKIEREAAQLERDRADFVERRERQRA
jgi:hypothetical protein